jgi:uncharacterized protein
MSDTAPSSAPAPFNGPVTEKERIASLDVLRGFAVLGILVMNIQSFSMIGAAYMNPYAYGDLGAANLFIWFASHLLFDMKFMAIFSMLFGAGVVLMADRRAAAGKPSAGVHYRRMLWLLLFGAAHGWLLWYGDILFTYAVCGLWIYLLRKLKPRTLIIIGIALVSVSSAVSLFWQFTMPWWPPGQIEQMNDEWWAPPPEIVAKENAAYRGSWTEQQLYRGPSVLFMQTFVLLTSMLWRCGGLMLIGMALYRLGYLSAEREDASYWRLIGFGLVVGVPLIIAGVVTRETTGWDVRTGFMGGSQFNYWGSVPVALAWIAVVMLVCRHGLFPKLTAALAMVGRMALSCYLLETVICTTIFYGHGLGLYGHVERTGQLAITVAVWTILLVFCPWWLARFRFGPFEWLWRSLTYWRLQPLKRG